jgi:tricorn protease
VILPPKAGNIGALIPFEAKLVYLRIPNTGSGERSSSLIFYDLEKREEKTIISDVSRVKATADGKALLVFSKGKYGIVKPAPNQKIEKPIPSTGLMMDLVPRSQDAPGRLG